MPLLCVFLIKRESTKKKTSCESRRFFFLVTRTGIEPMLPP